MAKNNQQVKVFEGKYCKTFIVVDGPKKEKKLTYRSVTPDKKMKKFNTMSPLTDRKTIEYDTKMPKIPTFFTTGKNSTQLSHARDILLNNMATPTASPKKIYNRNSSMKSLIQSRDISPFLGAKNSKLTLNSKLNFILSDTSPNTSSPFKLINLRKNDVRPLPSISDRIKSFDFKTNTSSKFMVSGFL